MQNKYFIINKPHGMLSQFTREVPEHRVLGDLYDFPKTVYPVGRLDKDSEGLLILTDDKKLTDRLLNPKHRHQRTYWAQVEGIPTKAALQQLQTSVTIKINKKSYRTLPTTARLLENVEIPPRNPPIRYRANIPTAWLQLQLTEGKNRQVRRMCAKVGFPVLRLLRVGIEDLQLSHLEGQVVKALERDFIYRQLFKK